MGALEREQLFQFGQGEEVSAVDNDGFRDVAVVLGAIFRVDT